MDVTLDQAACAALFAMLKPATLDGDECTEIRLQYGDGHSGHGLYASLAEYPEEGSELLVATRRPLLREHPAVESQRAVESAVRPACEVAPAAKAKTRPLTDHDRALTGAKLTAPAGTDC